MERREHSAWAKDRAFKILDNGDGIEAWTSFISDMGKHEELQDHKAIEMGMMMLMAGFMSTSEECRKFIDGFN